MQRISAKDIVVILANGIAVKFERVTLTPELGTVGVRSQGHPDGWVRGAVEADGEVQLVTEEMLKINEAVGESGGSWESFPDFPMPMVANIGGVSFQVVAHGVKLNAPDFNFDPNSGERTMHTLKFAVTGPEFIQVNGVPLADSPLA